MIPTAAHRATNPMNFQEIAEMDGFVNTGGMLLEIWQCSEARFMEHLSKAGLMAEIIKLRSPADQKVYNIRVNIFIKINYLYSSFIYQNLLSNIFGQKTEIFSRTKNRNISKKTISKQGFLVKRDIFSTPKFGPNS